MIRKKHLSVISAALALAMLMLMLLGGCGAKDNTAEPAETVPAADPVSVTEPAEEPEAEPAEEPETAAEAPEAEQPEAEPAQEPETAIEAPEAEQTEAEPEPARQDGERFEAVIILEGMAETVRYEHIRNEALGFEMDYDYESFVRVSEADRERFISCWDDAENPENYLELTRSTLDAAAAADAIGETLSKDYEINRDDAFPLELAGSCIRIDASADVGGLTMPEQLQMVYIIPASDGCRIATAHYAIEASEGFGRRFHYIMDSFAVIDGQEEGRLSAEQALAAVRNYCLSRDPELESMLNDGEHELYWDVQSSDDSEIVILFRSYTGALIRYYVDPVSGETFVTEFVPGITADEERTDESLNVRDYLD